MKPLVLGFLIWLGYVIIGLILAWFHRGKRGDESQLDYYLAYAGCWPMLLIDLYVRRK
jgi:hypothetical protein